jgi:hypothetical protein
MWTEAEVSAWFAKGKRRRAVGKTEAPVKPDDSWKEETLDDIEDDFGEDGGPSVKSLKYL